MRGKMIKTDRRKLLLDALKLIGISGRDSIPYCRGIFQLGPEQSEVNKTYQHSRKEKLKA
jgi:hypothetical protein